MILTSYGEVKDAPTAEVEEITFNREIYIIYNFINPPSDFDIYDYGALVGQATPIVGKPNMYELLAMHKSSDGDPQLKPLLKEWDFKCDVEITINKYIMDGVELDTENFGGLVIEGDTNISIPKTMKEVPNYEIRWRYINTDLIINHDLTQLLPPSPTIPTGTVSMYAVMNFLNPGNDFKPSNIYSGAFIGTDFGSGSTQTTYEFPKESIGSTYSLPMINKYDFDYDINVDLTLKGNIYDHVIFSDTLTTKKTFTINKQNYDDFNFTPVMNYNVSIERLGIFYISFSQIVPTNTIYILELSITDPKSRKLDFTTIDVIDESYEYEFVDGVARINLQDKEEFHPLLPVGVTVNKPARIETEWGSIDFDNFTMTPPIIDVQSALGMYLEVNINPDFNAIIGCAMGTWQNNGMITDWSKVYGLIIEETQTQLSIGSNTVIDINPGTYDQLTIKHPYRDQMSMFSTSVQGFANCGPNATIEPTSDGWILRNIVIPDSQGLLANMASISLYVDMMIITGRI